MTLTYDGKLGINQSTPVNTLHVVGTSTVTSDAFVGGDLTVSGTISGTVALDPVITSNLNTTSGVTTISTLKVTGSADFDATSFVGLGTNVGIGTDSGAENYGLDIQNKLRVNEVLIAGSNPVLTVQSGFVTATQMRATGGFISSGVGTHHVRITYETSPDRVVFNIPGVGSTSLQLF